MFRTGRTPSKFRRQEHLGIGYVGAACAQAGHEVEVVNAQYECLSVDEVLARVAGFEPEIVGVSLYESQIPDTRAFLRGCTALARRPLTAVGGHSASFNATTLIREWDELDLVAIGEAELSFPRLLAAIEAGEWPARIPGFCFRDGDQVVSTGYPDKVPRLDDLPYPLRPAGYKGLAMTNISASRGCHAACTFCSTIPFYQGHRGKQIRSRDPVAVVDEIEHVVRTQGARHIFFTDDNFFVNELIQPGWISAMCDEIERRKLDIIFNFDCRVDEVDRELFGRMKEVGLVGVFLGVESDSTTTLGLYNKKTTPVQNLRAIEILRSLRIDYWFGNIMFHPFTKMPDIGADIAFLRGINYHRYFNYAYPLSCFAGVLEVYTDTPIHRELERRGAVKRAGVVVEYDFLDPRTNGFYQLIQEWHPYLEPLVARDAIFLIEIANSMGRSDLAAAVHKVSRRYMRVDFELFSNMHAAVGDTAVPLAQAVANARELLDAAKPVVIELDRRLRALELEILPILERARAERGAIAVGPGVHMGA
ncbi:MAG: radical SAM protein [Enhygromyxa sp.]